MQSSNVFLSAFLLIATASLASAQISVRVCQGIGAVNNVTIVETDNARVPTVNRGRTYTIKISYVAAKDASSLKTEWFAIMGGRPLPWTSQTMAPGCAVTSPSCPIKTGKVYTYVERFTVPSDSPVMRALVRVVQSAPNGDQVLCANFPLNIKM